MQFISAKVDIRFLPDDMDSAFVLFENEKFPLHRTNRNENCHTKRNNLSVKNIGAVGLKEFLGGITRISSSPYSYGFLSIHPYQYLKPLFSKINDEKSLLSFCKRYADWLLEEYGENYGYEEEIYRKEGLLADYSINEDYDYFHYINR